MQNEKLKKQCEVFAGIGRLLFLQEAMQDILVQQGCENLINIVEGKNYDSLNVSTLCISCF